jgi:hypothetical protein
MRFEKITFQSEIFLARTRIAKQSPLLKKPLMKWCIHDSYPANYPIFAKKV